MRLVLLVILLWAAALIGATAYDRARAQEPHRGFPFAEWRHDRRVEHHYRHVEHDRAPEPYIDYSWTDNRDRDAHHHEDDGRGVCIDPVRGVGTQDIRQEAALHNAKKDWMERVRYDHGESFIDMTYAKDFLSRCNRVSIGELAGAVTYRCEIWARPCQGVLTEKGPQFTIKDREETEARDQKDEGK